MWCRIEAERGNEGTRERGNEAGRAPELRTAVPPYRRSPGFTLIEILVVITVIAILASLVAPMVFRNVGDAKVAAARAQIEIFGLALDSYRLDNDYYPSTEQGLAALRELSTGEPAARNWRGPYLRKEIPLDPWDRPYVYRSPGEVNPTSYDLLTLGRDGAPGGEGEDADVTSWGAEGTDKADKTDATDKTDKVDGRDEVTLRVSQPFLSVPSAGP